MAQTLSQKKYWTTSKGKAAQRRKNYKRLYGITPEQYEVMFEQQRGLCRVCDRPSLHQRLAVDHCHLTGFVRGLLCNACNTAIAQLQDSPERARRAAEYLEKAR
jgi:Recombination endonuclease VII